MKPANKRRAVGVLIGFILGLAALSLYSCFRSGWDDKPEPSGYGTVP